MSTIAVSTSLIFFPILLALILAIPVTIGVYVYRDARSRGMNAPLWTLVAIVAPSFIGLIIYLIVRSEHSALFCPACAFRVSESFSVCPNCGHSLKCKCQNCGMPLESGWKICPGCSEPILASTAATIPARPAAKHDKGIGRLLLLIILIPLLLCGLLLVPLLVYRAGFGGQADLSSLSTIENVSIDAFEDMPWVTDWINRCDTLGDGFYVLSHESRSENGKCSAFLIYRTGLTSKTESSCSVGDGAAIILSYADFPGAGERPYHLTYIEYVGKKHADLKIRLLNQDSEVSYTLTESDDPIPPYATVRDANQKQEKVSPPTTSQ